MKSLSILAAIGVIVFCVFPMLDASSQDSTKTNNKGFTLYIFDIKQAPSIDKLCPHPYKITGMNVTTACPYPYIPTGVRVTVKNISGTDSQIEKELKEYSNQEYLRNKNANVEVVAFTGENNETRIFPIKNVTSDMYYNFLKEGMSNQSDTNETCLSSSSSNCGLPRPSSCWIHDEFWSAHIRFCSIESS